MLSGRFCPFPYSFSFCILTTTGSSHRPSSLSWLRWKSLNGLLFRNDLRIIFNDTPFGTGFMALGVSFAVVMYYYGHDGFEGYYPL